MAILEEITGPQPGRRFRIESSRNVLGRHPDCDVVLDSAAVSREHAMIMKIGDDYFVEDMKSRNGTYVNDNVIHGRYQLNTGDRIKVCDLLFKIIFDAPLSSQKMLMSDNEGSTSIAMFVDDQLRNSSSTIMSKVDVSSGYGGVMLTANPQVKLKALIEILQNLGKTLKLEDVLPKVLDSLFKIFVQADRGFIALKYDGQEDLVPKAVKHRLPGVDETIRISRTIVNQVVDSKEAILSADAAHDQRFDMSQSIVGLSIRSMMCAPLVSTEGEVLGVIQVDTMDESAKFQIEDLEVLASVATPAAAAIDNAHLHESALKQRQLQRDLEIAHKVQQSLLPLKPPEITGYHFFDYYHAALQVGGDFYDYIELPQGKIAVVVADVSGKGVSAALLMAKLTADVRYCLASEATPSGAITRLNRNFEHSGWNDHFVTLVLTVLNPTTGEVQIVNAGHMAPLLRKSDCSVEEIGEEEAGFPVGVVSDQVYQQFSITLEPGEFLTLFSDGISEAMNLNEEIYGLQRLREQVGAPIQSVSELGKHILEDVRKFVGNTPQSDDMCLACFGRDRNDSNNS